MDAHRRDVREANTSHPKPELWVGLVDAFVRHLRERYGVEEVRSLHFAAGFIATRRWTWMERTGGRLAWHDKMT